MVVPVDRDGCAKVSSGDSCGDESPITLPTVLDPFAEGAARRS